MIAEDRVPLLEPGTPYAEVVDALVAWGLEPIPVMKSNAIVVRQGPSRRNFGMADPAYVVYSFDDESLAFGPSDAAALGRRLTEEEYSDDTLALLTSLDEIEALDADTLNTIAWELATHPLPRQRYPALALSIAQRAANDSGYADYFIVDTLAASYAAVGDFENAVRFQETAIVLADGNDPELDERLALYRSEQAYAQFNGGVTPDNPFPLMQRAAGGDAQALFEIGAMCVDRPIQPCLGNDPDPFFWIEAAAASGHGLAIDHMAYARLMGTMATYQDIDEGTDWLQQGLENDSALATWHAATAIRHEIMQDRDDTLITHLLRLSADADIWDAGLEVGYRLIEGVGADSDPVAGESYIDEALEAGMDTADLLFFDLTYFFERAEEQTAIEFTEHKPLPARSVPSRLLALADDLRSQAKEGQTTVTARFERYHVGWSAADASYAALELTHHAARLGSAEAQRRLATYYSEGKLVAASDREANYWRERAESNTSGL